MQMLHKTESERYLSWVSLLDTNGRSFVKPTKLLISKNVRNSKNTRNMIIVFVKRLYSERKHSYETFFSTKTIIGDSSMKIFVLKRHTSGVAFDVSKKK